MAASTDPAPDPQPQPKPELAERVGAIEAEQQRQGDILERIEQALGKGTAPTGGAGSTAEPDAGLTVQEQVRRGVEEIEAEKQRKADETAAKDADSAWRANVDQRLAERKPSEPATGRKAKLQERLFGKADAR